MSPVSTTAEKDAPAKPVKPAPAPSPKATAAPATRQLPTPRMTSQDPWKHLHPARVWPD